jgi:hypothetical protein
MKGPKRKKIRLGRWVKLKELCNPAFKEIPDDVIRNLREMGWMKPNTVWPSDLAFELRVVQIGWDTLSKWELAIAPSLRKPFGLSKDKKKRQKAYWDRTRYISERRKIRREKKREQELEEGWLKESISDAERQEIIRLSGELKRRGTN